MNEPISHWHGHNPSWHVTMRHSNKAKRIGIILSMNLYQTNQTIIDNFFEFMISHTNVFIPYIKAPDS